MVLGYYGIRLILKKMVIYKENVIIIIFLNNFFCLVILFFLHLHHEIMIIYLKNVTCICFPVDCQYVSSAFSSLIRNLYDFLIYLIPFFLGDSAINELICDVFDISRRHQTGIFRECDLVL